jgi:hypothetical protein
MTPSSLSLREATGKLVSINEREKNVGVPNWQPACYSVKTTDCTPEISNRLRQCMFLQAIMSSLRSM